MYATAALWLGAAGATPPPPATLDQASLPAAGRHDTVLRVGAFGRYAVTVASAQGVALQAVDRMAGAGPVQGEAGKQDGRLDLFLDQGEQRIVTLGAEQARGTARLAVHPFRELQDRVPLLVEQRVERTSLGDFEQRSYWIEIKTRRTVALEAAGRHLADLRLWRDGTWLVDARPKMTQSPARPEQPLAVARLWADLEPGLYLLTAYGGPGQPWTEASEAQPLLLRFGLPALGPAARRRYTMSEFGVERFVVPAGPTHFRLELPSAAPATLQVGAFLAREPFRGPGASASIDKSSLPPVAELDETTDAERIVTVTAPAGQPFVLQYFEARRVVPFHASGDYWVSSIHAGAGGDSIDASGVLTRLVRGGSEEFVGQQVVELDARVPWHRRFNLLEPTTLFLMVAAPAQVRVSGTGADARYRFEPFLAGARPARDAATPAWQASGHVFDLDRGLHVLSLAPDVKGILDLTLEVVAAPGAPGVAGASPMPARSSVRFAPLHLEDDSDYRLYLNQQPGVLAGAVLRPLPIDLAQPLPIDLQAGEVLDIAVRAPEAGRLRALGEDGSDAELALEDGRKGTALDLSAGLHQVTIAGGAAARGLSLLLEPARLDGAAPLPQLPDARLADLPQFPRLAAGAPQPLVLARHRTRTYRVQVEHAGLYRFETTGLLATGGKVRTRVQTALFDEKENGVGRNVLIQRYLREGEYQLTLGVEGETRGDLGVQLSRSEEIDGGTLGEGEVARAPLPPGHALSIRLHIARAGRYHVQALGLERRFDVRLEDGQGWPVAAPVQPGDITQELQPGDYRMIVLPQPVEARVLARLQRVEEAVALTGHGPHALALGGAVEHTWVEPAPGAVRVPDEWEFVLTAPARTTLALTNGMTGQLVEAGAPARTVATVEAIGSWRGDLPAGRYRLRAVHGRGNNFVRYTVRVDTDELVPGQTRALVAPAALALSVGRDGLVDLASFGASDVRARLLDGQGRTVAQNDDRPDDWNFQIAQRLAPGRYTLQVDPVGSAHAATSVAMTAPGEIGEPPLAAGAARQIADDQVHVYPLALPADADAILASAQSADVVGLALEGQTAAGWTGLGMTVGHDAHLLLPLAPQGYRAIRLRAWSADRRSRLVAVRVAARAVPAATEEQWLQGHAGARMLDEQRPGLRVARIELARPGTFRLAADPARWAWSDSTARVAGAGASDVICATGRNLWLLAAEEALPGAGAVAPLPAAERLHLPALGDEALRVELAAGQQGTVDARPGTAGPALIIAQARTGQPGVAVGARREAAAMGFVAGESVAFVAPAAQPAGVLPVSVWNASGAAPLELDLRQVVLQGLAAVDLLPGANDGRIAGRGALPARLPEGVDEVRLTLTPGTAAVLVRHGAIVSTHWSGADALQETIATGGAEQLWLLNAASDEAPYRVEAVRGSGRGGAQAALQPGGLLERNLGTAGRLRVAVDIPRSGDYHLRVRGPAGAVWQEEGGRIAHGSDLDVHGPGVLWLQHEPGTVVAWLDDPQPVALDRIRRWIAALRETTVKVPQSVELDGKQQVLQLDLPRVTLLHLRTSVPVVTQLLVAGLPARTEAHLHGANVNLLVPAGQSKLVLRAVGAESLSGMATVLAAPDTALDEGTGPEALLGPAGAHLYHFDLPTEASIGIGVRTTADVVSGTLYDERGAALAEGVVQMPRLARGRYYLALEAPVDAAPVRVQAIVLGLRAPRTGPPAEVLRAFVQTREDAALPPSLLFVPPQPGAAAPDAGAPDAVAPPDAPGDGEPADAREPGMTEGGDADGDADTPAGAKQ